jgi:hypothetical protein
VADDNSKILTIIVNTAPHSVEKRKYSYNEIVEFAYPGSGGSPIYLVKYSSNDNSKNSIRLKPDEAVMVHEGMIFRVTSTGES